MWYVSYLVDRLMVSFLLWRLRRSAPHHTRLG
jgi:hypothetical protein